MINTGNTQGSVAAAEAPKAPETLTNEKVEQAQAPAAVETPAPKKEDPFSPRFAALSRQEKQLREQQAQYKAQREAESREWQAKIDQAKRVEELKVKAKTDRTAALDLLKEVGLTFDELTKMQLNGGKPTPEMIAEQARREVEELRKEQRERDEQAKTEAQKAKDAHIERSIQTFKGQIDSFLKADPDTYELTANYSDPHTGATGADLVYQVIEAHYDQTEKAEGTGRVMTHEEAAKAVEEYLEKEYEEKILARKKIQAKLGKTGPTAGSDGADGTDGGAAGSRDSGDGNTPVVSQSSQKSAGARTLTNQDQAKAGGQPPAPKKMSREESLKHAASLLVWK